MVYNDNNKVSLRRSIIGSIRRSISPFSNIPKSTNTRGSVQSALDIPNAKRNKLLPTRAASTAGRYTTVFRQQSEISNETSPTSTQIIPSAQRQSVVSFQLPPAATKDSPPNNASDTLLTIRPPSSSGRQSPFRSGWSFLSRNSSVKSRATSISKLKLKSSHLQLGPGRETSFSQRNLDDEDADEEFRPRNPPFERSIDIFVKDEEDGPTDPNVVFGQALPPRSENSSPKLFDLPVHIRRRIYGYCFPEENRKIGLSPRFATQDCFFDDYFASPWDVLIPVRGGLASFSLMRNELMTFFWTEYKFHVTLNPFSGPFFSPLSHVWMPRYLDRIQYLTLEADFTRFGCGALKIARQFGYDMEKVENLLVDVVNGLLKRSNESTMAELHFMCRRFKGNRAKDVRDPWDWRDGDQFEYCPEETMWLCDVVINLRGILKRARMSGFPVDYTETLLHCIFGENEDGVEWECPIESAWPPLPSQSSLVYSKKLSVPPSRPISPTSKSYSISAETIRTGWAYEPSLYSNKENEDSDGSPTLIATDLRPGTSHSTLTIADHVKNYQDVLPSLDSIESLKQDIEMTITEEGEDFQVKRKCSQNMEEPTPTITKRPARSRKNSDTRFPGESLHKKPKINNSSTTYTPLPTTPIISNKRKSQFKERSMSDLPESPLDRKYLTPPPPTQPLSTASPNTLNHINEKDPAYLRSLDALRSASASASATSFNNPELPLIPKTRTARPFSMGFPTSNMRVDMDGFQRAVSERSTTSVGLIKNGSILEGSLGRRYLKFIDKLRGRRS